MRKSHFCGISANFFECCFISETQLLMEVSDFFYFFSKNKNRFLENGYILNEDIGLMGQVFKKNHGMGDATPQPSSPFPTAITTTTTTMPPSSTRGKLEHKTRNIVCCRPLSNLFSGIAVQEVFRRFPRSPHETISFNKRSLFFSFKKKNWWKSSFN